MKNKYYLSIIFITIVILGLISLGKSAASIYYQFHYNSILQISIYHLCYILVGVLVGVEHLMTQCSSPGVWHLDKQRLLWYTFPLLILYLLIIINFEGIFTKGNIVLNSFFNQGIGVFIGYSIAKSFSKS